MNEMKIIDVWKKEEELPKIITQCKGLDDALRGGIPLQMVTELCGAPGSGKTQMCLQLSVNVQLPKLVSGVEGRAIYVDTNQGFNPHRLQEISVHLQDRFHRIFKNKSSPSCEMGSEYHNFYCSSILNRVHHIYCTDYVELLAAVDYIKTLLLEMSDIKLIVIDSFSFPLRSIDDVSKRTTINYELLANLEKMAFDNEIAIVITNELTTRIMERNAKVCPALGETHAHKIGQRILLSRNQEKLQRVAFIEKCLLSPKLGIPFKIEDSGIRGSM